MVQFDSIRQEASNNLRAVSPGSGNRRAAFH